MVAWPLRAERDVVQIREPSTEAMVRVTKMMNEWRRLIYLGGGHLQGAGRMTARPFQRSEYACMMMHVVI
jgi:hypothetical protein